MDLISHVTMLGGAASRAEIVEKCGRGALDRAVRDGVLDRVGRGRYALPSASKSVRVAAAYGGTVSMRSAAQLHGWGQRLVPARPDVTFARTRRLEPAARRALVPHWSDLPPEDVERGVTTKRRTLVDCMRNLPLEDAVPIVDSALRRRDVTKSDLIRLAFGMRGRGRARAIAVALMATRAAANAYESTLRAIASTIPGLSVRAQQPLRVASDQVLHPDLLDDRLGIVIEAESFEWHGDRRRLASDCWRYNAFANLGYLVVRFSWEQVIFNAPYVVEVLVRAVRRAHRHANVAAGAVDQPGGSSSHIRMPGGTRKAGKAQPKRPEM